MNIELDAQFMEWVVAYGLRYAPDWSERHEKHCRAAFESGYAARLLEKADGNAPGPEETPDPRGYVFIDLDGDAWGWDATSTHRGPQWCADRPFKTRMEAEDAAKYCRYGCQRIEVWTPESRVPPMPEKQP